MRPLFNSYWMHRFVTLLTFCGFTLTIHAADFQNGQAARAVIGQSSFSAHDAGITVTALSLSNGRLYVADNANHLLVFDLSQIPGAKDDFADRQSLAVCAVCGFSPVAILNQSVTPGVAGASVSGKSVAIADPANHRVLVWLDATTETALRGPDVVLGTTTAANSGVTASTLVDPISVALDGQRLYVGDAALHRVLIWNSLPRTDNQPADVVLGQSSFASSSVPEVPAADTITWPVALEADGTNLYVADSVNRRVLVFTAADEPLASNSLANSASQATGPVAPGTLVTISAAGFTQSSSTAEDGSGNPLPKTLGGVEVLFDGAALPLLSVSPNEIRAQVPYDVTNRSSASLYVRAQTDAGLVISNPIAVSLAPATPGLFAFSGQEPRPGMTVHAEQGVPVTLNSPAQPGETVTLWATGLGNVTGSGVNGSATVTAGVPASAAMTVQNPVAATVSGTPAEVLSATLPQGAVGIYEIRVLLPSSLPVNGATTLVISQDGSQSNTVTIPVGTSIQ